MNHETVLIVEDEPEMILGLRKILEAEGYKVSVAQNGEAGLRAAQSESPALVILDVMLPKKSGFDVVREMRARGDRMPVLMLTAKSQETDKVLGLEFGADDYLTKPFGIPELLARVRALLRRTDLRADRVERISIAGLDVDFKQQVIRGKKGCEALSTHENGILRLLVAFKGEPVSRKKILDDVWEGTTTTDRTVDFHVVNLRKKIETVTGARSSPCILTVHGTGYKFVG
jgi:DNA-binding response OmpR family regulator